MTLAPACGANVDAATLLQDACFPVAGMVSKDALPTPQKRLTIREGHPLCELH